MHINPSRTPWSYATKSVRRYKDESGEPRVCELEGPIPTLKRSKVDITACSGRGLSSFVSLALCSMPDAIPRENSGFCTEILCPEYGSKRLEEIRSDFEV